MSEPQVLIVGAGPTGLVLALFLSSLGVRVRIIDKLAEAGTTSRALVVHARTLEFYRQIDLADDVVRRGLRFVSANLWVKGRKAGHIEFGAMGRGQSRFPYMLIFPQDEHERLLIDRLATRGVTVERLTEFVGCEQLDGHVVVKLRLSDGSEETCSVEYVAGCDGAHSAVRQLLGASFPGGTYNHMFYVADVAASGPVMNGELHVALDTADFLAVFPLAGDSRARLIGTIRIDAIENMEAFQWKDVSGAVINRLGVHVDQVNWFSTYRVHHRVVDRFRRGRIFLLGDAAHIHSPVGGQGMNTGIGDAVNLAWKLADVLMFRADPTLLDSYEPERMAFARRLVATTDRAFTFVTSDGRLARLVRTGIVPRVLPPLYRTKAVRRFMFRALSQIAINYRSSPISEGSVGSLRAGDRLPWIENADTTGGMDNFEPLTSLAWQVHVYGSCTPQLADYCAKHQLKLETFPYSAEAERKGIRRDAVYLLRPDGYIAFASPRADVPALDLYLTTRIVQRQIETHSR